MARSPGGGDFVALKILPPSLADEQTIARFRRESEIVKKLHHPNIVGCVEFGFDKRRRCYFCALEFVQGEDLAKRITRLGTLPEDEAISITTQTAMALQHAYFNGLVHRDVKPENVMVTPDGRALLLDLGLARPANQEATRMTESGMFVGTAYYASPEQALGEKEVDTRSDIYSLGATLYHMVTGKPPFEGATVLAILQKHLTDQLPWPADVNPDISDALCAIIARMMAKDPDDRYQTPNELNRDLDLLVEGKEPEVQDAALKNSSVKVPALRRRRRERPASRARRPAGSGSDPTREDRPSPLRGRSYKRREAPRDRAEGVEPSAAGRPAGPAAKIAMIVGVVVLMIVIGLLLLVGRGKRDRRRPRPGAAPVESLKVVQEAERRSDRAGRHRPRRGRDGAGAAREGRFVRRADTAKATADERRWKGGLLLLRRSICVHLRFPLPWPRRDGRGPPQRAYRRSRKTGSFLKRSSHARQAV